MSPPRCHTGEVKSAEGYSNNVYSSKETLVQSSHMSFYNIHHKFGGLGEYWKEEFFISMLSGKNHDQNVLKRNFLVNNIIQKFLCLRIYLDQS